MNYVLLTLLACASLPALAAETLAIDQTHSAVVFSWNHVGLSNPVARLEQLDGQILLDADDITKSSVSVDMPLAGLHTGVDLLDRRLKGDQFFEATRYPTISFRSTSIAKGPMNTLKITGDLTLHGITKSVVLDAKLNLIRPANAAIPGGAGFDAETVLRRTDYALDRYVPSVSDEVRVHITLEAYKKT